MYVIPLGYRKSFFVVVEFKDCTIKFKYSRLADALPSASFDVQPANGTLLYGVSFCLLKRSLNMLRGQKFCDQKRKQNKNNDYTNFNRQLIGFGQSMTHIIFVG